MAIPTSRAVGKGKIQVDEEKCTGCGTCALVCKDGSLEIREQKAVASHHALLGCIACGHCMAVCPHGAIEISGRTLGPTHVFDLGRTEKITDYGQLLSLLQRRRSMRDFLEKEVPTEIVNQILDAAATAPMGIPPSDVGVLVLHGAKANADFANNFAELVNSQKWIFSGPMLFLLRAFIAKTDYQMLKNFAGPAFLEIVKKIKEGKNMLTYSAPLSMYFYGSPFSDTADPILAATLAMCAGESLGLGTCCIGLVHPMVQNGKEAAKFREKYGIKHKSKSGIMVIFGYPSLRYQKGIKRSFASVSLVDQ